MTSKWPAVCTFVAATLVLATTGVPPTVRAEPPDGYYAAAIGESGAALKDALHVIIDGHTPLPYTDPENDNWFDSQGLDVWEALAYTDSACTGDVPACGKVRLLYLDETRDLVQAYRGGRAGCQDLWEREHVWPTSREFKNQEMDGYTDLHHIRPADKDVNNRHSNYGYNHGGDEVFDKSKGCRNRRASARLSRENQSFEPPDRAKGQVARMLFYMDVRYESGDDLPPESMPDLSLKAANAKVKEPWQGEGTVDRTSLQAVGVEPTVSPDAVRTSAQRPSHGSAGQPQSVHRQSFVGRRHLAYSPRSRELLDRR